MNNLEKTFTLLTKISQDSKLLQYADRIELKRQRSSHYRLYVAMIADTKQDVLIGLDELVEPFDFTANPYKKGGFLTSVSFADNDEPQGKR